jgi:hypothetical protein
MEIKQRIIDWASRGGDFDSGIALFLTFNRNVFYARNIQLKGIDRGMITLLSEFSVKSKIPVQVLSELISNKGGSEIQQTRQFSEVNVTNRDECKAPITAITQEYIRKGNKLREEFPFLSRRDCPDELAILVNKMITAYEDYRTFKQDLFEIDRDDLIKCYESARKVLDAYILNRDIWEELNHYKATGKILGKLPEFKAKRVREEFLAMGTISLVRISGNNIPRKMSYYKKQLNDDKTKNKDDIREKMAEAEMELDVIKEILKERGEM